MTLRLLSSVAVASLFLVPGAASGQGSTPMAPTEEQLALKNYLPIGRPANLKPSAVPDLSGDWELDRKRGWIGQSISAADPGGRLRGKEPDIKYRPWSLAKTMSEVPPTGPDAKYETNTDPQIHFCEPSGVAHIYMHPVKRRFVQTPDYVYILHEMGPHFQMVRLKEDHPEDPDPQYWGHSIGWYENGDTLVVDTIGFNDRTWLDQLGHPHTERMHTVERYRRVNADTLEYDILVDDPAAYEAPIPGHRNFSRSTTGFLRYQWVCSVRDNIAHYEKTSKDANEGNTTFKTP